MAWTVPWQLMGTWVSGDVGGHTIYTDKFGRKVVFPKAPPDKPPSPSQVLQRANFAQAQKGWAGLTDQQKKDLENVVKRTSICMTGQNLWMSLVMMDSVELKKTLEHQTGITLPVLP